MLLLTQDQRARLIANGQSRGDHVPVVKFFNPVGAGTWLFSELDEDGDSLFGLCDLGFGCPEMGSASLAEIVAVTPLNERTVLLLKAADGWEFLASLPASAKAPEPGTKVAASFASSDIHFFDTASGERLHG